MIDINDKVVCVNDQFDPWVKRLYRALPVQGMVYVVRDVLLGVRHSPRGRSGATRLLLVGLVNDWAGKTPTTERGFDAERFRKLDQLPAQTAEVTEKELVPA